jgi:hypothetical protein
MKKLFFASALLVATAAIGTPAEAQNYPWCSNFADGAGTNCGFPTLEQCKATIAGSGGYCDQNTLYETSVAPAPLFSRRGGQRYRRRNGHPNVRTRRR